MTCTEDIELNNYDSVDDKAKNEEIAKEILEKLCSIVLVNGDILDTEDAVGMDEVIEYITEINAEQVLSGFSECHIKNSVHAIVERYISGFSKLGDPKEPFSFDTHGELEAFRKCFSDRYVEKTSSGFPTVLNSVFDEIISIRKEYNRFAVWYRTQVDLLWPAQIRQLKDRLKEIQDQAEKTINDAANRAAEEAASQAQKLADEAAKNAEKAKNKAKTAAEDASLEAKKKVAEVEADLRVKSAETSVTILGIFAAIVITTVAGLFFSSSVMGSINEAPVWRLILGASVVGLICFNMIALMITHISRFTGEKVTEYGKKRDKWIIGITIAINTIFIGLLIISLFATFITDPYGNDSTSVSASVKGNENQLEHDHNESIDVSVEVSGGIDISGDIGVIAGEQGDKTSDNPGTGDRFT